MQLHKIPELSTTLPLFSPQFDDVLAKVQFGFHFLPYLDRDILQLLHMPLFEFLQRFESDLLVLAHIDIPVCTKLLKLLLLDLLHTVQLLNMCNLQEVSFANTLLFLDLLNLDL